MSTEEEEAPIAGLAERIKKLAAEVGGLDALAQRAGVPRRTLGHYLAGREPKLSGMVALAQAGQTTVDWLATGRGPMHPVARGLGASPGDKDEVLVPLYDVAVAAGSGRLIDDAFIVEYLSLPRHALLEAGGEPRSMAAFRAEGKSMEPTIRHGEVVLCDMSKNHVRSDLVYAFRMTGEMRVKRFRVGLKSDFIISSDNHDFPTEMLDIEDVDDFEIIGQILLVYNRHVA